MKARVPLFNEPNPTPPSAINDPRPSTPPPSLVTAVEAVEPSDAESTFSPLPWSNYFDSQRDVSLPPPHQGSRFRVYTAGAQSSDPPFVVLLIHGGGQSSLSWACVAAHLKPHVSVLAMDLRGHGDTTTEDDLDLSASTAVADIAAVVTAVYAPAPPPPVLVAGHSLGGALAIRLTASKLLSVIGCLCVDLVEGSALASMDHIRASVSSRPAVFPSLPSAIEWALRSSLVLNPQSARVSVPPQLVRSAAEQGVYVWRTDLLASQRHWEGWFRGLSAMFLGCSCPKLLMLASVDRLDGEMAVGQMQGKLQVEVVRNAGHQLMEDQPREVARLMLEWMQRQQMGRRARMMREGGGLGHLVVQPISQNGSAVRR